MGDGSARSPGEAGGGRIIDLPELRDRRHVFRDREHAGQVLAGMLADLRGSDALVFAIPAGGVPVAARLAEALGLALDVAVVSKITLPWNTEVGCGAIAFDGSMLLNEGLIAQVGLSQADLRTVITRTREKVRRRVALLRQGRPWPDLSDRLALVVDDGLASGYTMQVAIQALRRLGAERIYVAVPTAHRQAAQWIAMQTQALYCANLRGGWGFAVAEAYAQWTDVDEDEVLRFLGSHSGRGAATTPEP